MDTARYVVATREEEPRLRSIHRRSLSLVFFLAMASGVSPAHAQQAGLLVLEAPASTEAMAYGNTPYLYSRESGMLFYAPALIPRATGVAAGLHRYGSAGTLATLSGAGEGLGGGFAVGLQYMQYGSEPGSPVARDSQSVALNVGSVGVTEFVASLGYGREIYGLSSGVVVKYVEQSLNQSGDRTIAVDLGVAGEIGPFMVSLAGQNLGQDLEIVVTPCPGCVVGPGPDTTVAELPRQVVGGLSLDDFQVGPLDMFVTVRTTRRRDGQFIPAGGLEISYWPVSGYTFRLRGGLQRVVEDARSPFTFGAAFTGDNITIEYAFQEFDGTGNAHRFGLRWR